MKSIFKFLSISALVTVSLFSLQCTSSTQAEAKQTQLVVENEQEGTEIKAYYFHGTRRCMTCQAVEKVAKEALQAYNNGEIALLSLNREEEANQALVEKYQVSGQTLLIVKGDQIIDLTNEAFMNARNNPKVISEKIVATIEGLK